MFLIVFFSSGILLWRNKIIGAIIGIGGSVYLFRLALSHWKLQSLEFTIAGIIFAFYLGCIIYLLGKKSRVKSWTSIHSKTFAESLVYCSPIPYSYGSGIEWKFSYLLVLDCKKDLYPLKGFTVINNNIHTVKKNKDNLV